MATTAGDPAELLVVLVDERARVVVDVADGHPTEAIGIAQPAVARPGEHGIDGRARLAQQRAKAVRTPAPFHPGGEDRLYDLGSGQPGRAAGSRAAVLETGPALAPIAPEPLVGGGSTHALGLGSLGRRPAIEFDATHQELPAKDVETRRTMGHESFLRAWVLNTPNHGAKLSFVNNVSGNHT
jgi:hypothetical protein